MPEPETFTIAGLAGQTSDLSALSGVIGALGFSEALDDAGAGPFTVFAPNNNAVEGVLGVLDSLGEDGQRTILGYHVVPGVVNSVDVVPGARFDTLAGETLVIGSDGTLPGGFSVIDADLPADNGVVHVIDGVLTPPSIALANLTSSIADLEGIQFDVNSATIRPGSFPILDNAASVINSLPEGTLVEVAGHTDSDGVEALNQALSQARADSVVAYLVGQGVSADVLNPVGFGEADLLIDPEETDADKQRNRRIEFTEPSS